MATFCTNIYRRQNEGGATHYNYYDGAMAERKEQPAGDWELSKADKSPGGIIDGTACGLALEEGGRCNA